MNEVDFVTRIIRVTTQLLNAEGEVNVLLSHYVSQGYSDPEILTDEAIQALYPGLTQADVVAAVGSLDAVRNCTAFSGGNRTNLGKLRNLLDQN